MWIWLQETSACFSLDIVRNDPSNPMGLSGWTIPQNNYAYIV